MTTTNETIPLQADIRDALRIAAQRTGDVLAQALMRDAADKLDALESERAELRAALGELLRNTKRPSTDPDVQAARTALARAEGKEGAA